MKKETKIYLASFFVPFFLFLFVLAILKFYPFGDDLFLLSDLKFQYNNFLAYLKTLFGENNLNYSFALLGSNFVGTMSYYLSSPFNILTLIIPNSVLPIFIPILIAIKIGASSVTMTYFLKKESKKFNYDILIFSFAYALSSYMICYSIHIIWLDICILFPLFIVGLNKIIENESSKFYIITLLIMIMVNYYITFMVCIFSVFYILYKLFIKKMDNKKRLVILKKYILSSLLAVLISSVILIPVILSLTTGKSEVALTPELFLSVGKLDYYLKALMTANYSWTLSLPNIFVGMFVLLLVVLYFFNTKINLREKIVSSIFVFVLLLFFADTGLNLVMHGFDYPNSFPYRFSFVFIFVLIFLAYKCFRNIEGIKKRDLFISLLFILISVYFIFDSYNKYLKLDCLLLIIYSILIYLYVYKKDLKFYKYILPIILILNTCNLFINARYDIREIKSQDFNSKKVLYDKKYIENEEVINYIKIIDSGFYRIEKTIDTNYNFNDAMMFNYKSVTNFNSTNDIKTLDFLENLGINRYIVTSSYDDGSTKFTDDILGIKYIYSGIPKYKGYEEVKSKIYKNTDAFNIGFITEENKTFDKDNTFLYQNALIKTISGKDLGDVYTKVNYKIEAENLEYKQREEVLPTGEKVEAKLYEKVDKNKNSKLIITINENNDYIYYYIDSMKFDQNIDVYINGEKIKDKTIGGPLNSPNPGMFYLGKGKFKIEFVLNDEEALKFEDMYAYKEDEEVLKDYLDAINSKGNVKLDLKTSSNIEGKVSMLSDGYLTFSIPYDKGWKIYIDGKKVSTEKMYDALLGVKLEKGSYNVNLIYTPPGRILGIFLSIVGAFLTVIYLRKENTKKAR